MQEALVRVLVLHLSSLCNPDLKLCIQEDQKFRVVFDYIRSYKLA